VDAVVIGTWPNLHCPVTVAALTADKHVLCEARMARNAQEAHAMWNASRARPHLVAQVVPAPLSFPVDKTVQRLLADGYLGELLGINVRASQGFLNPDSPLHWRQDFDLSGFNIMSLGIWYETVMRWVGDAIRVTAMGKTYVTTRRDEDGQMRAVRVPEHIDVLSDMACGAQLHVQVSSVTGLAPTAETWLFGSRATLRFADNKLWGGKRGDKGLAEIEIPEAERGEWRVEEEFVNAIRGLEPVKLTTFADGVKYMEWTEAVHRSMAEGRAIGLPLT
jgi:predicted dehydrogenase